LIGFLEDYSTCYATDQLFIMFGMDFNYQDAFQNYENMDKMIEYMNANHGDKYIFKYSTPSMYIDAINSIADREWPTKYEDLMPYGDDRDSWWTGYFSSRPNAKSYVRMGSHQLHAHDQLVSQAMLNQDLSEEDAAVHLNASEHLRKEMGVYQHHDAVAGTAK
jgi:lysosomal alpha-mannosidase